jgi:Trypsin-like peptidase domain
MFRIYYALVVVVLASILAPRAGAQVFRMTDGELGYRWTGFAIDEENVLTVAHADHDVAYIYTRVAMIACDRIRHDKDRDIAIFKCRMKHGQPVLKIAEETKSRSFKIIGHPGGLEKLKTVLYPLHSKKFNAKLRGSDETVLLLEGEAFMGMSGSPVVDPETGHVVGIQSAGGPEDTYCVSLEQVRKFLKR